MSDQVAEIRGRLDDPLAVVQRLGLDKGMRRQRGGVVILCPAHDDRTASCSVRLGRDGTIACRCQSCGWSGDVLHLVAVVEHLDIRRDFRAVLERAAELAGVHSGSEPPARPPPRRPTPLRTYPPADEVLGIWTASIPVSRDHEVASWLESRALEPASVELFDLARALPRGASIPRWASKGGRPWSVTGHRLVVAMRDARGVLRSLRARAVVATDEPKALPPTGHAIGGLVMACSLALQVLEAGEWPEWSARRTIVVAEGEPDWLTWATRWSDADERTPAVLGITNASWTDEIAGRVPAGSEVVIWTDGDLAGEQYASRIHASLAARCRVLRGGGQHGHDWCKAGRQ